VFENDSNKIRVVLGNYPLVVPEAIRLLLLQREDMDVVADIRGPMKILQDTGRTKADAVILTQDGTEEIGLSSHLLAIYPDLTVLSVTSDLQVAYTHRLCSHRRQLTQSEMQDIVQALCVAVRNPSTGKWF
jgi:DNA-binding NarL/FixJ family response regulator